MATLARQTASVTPDCTALLLRLASAAVKVPMRHENAATGERQTSASAGGTGNGLVTATAGFECILVGPTGSGTCGVPFLQGVNHLTTIDFVLNEQPRDEDVPASRALARAARILAAATHIAADLARRQERRERKPGTRTHTSKCSPNAAPKGSSVH